MKPKRKNVQDLTLKNLRALKRRIQKLAIKITELEINEALKSAPPIGPYPVQVRGLKKQTRKRGK